jgi:N-acetyl-gamma-glutamylphosphate reductase
VIRVVRPADLALVSLLSGHPGVEVVDGFCDCALCFDQDGWERRLVVGDPSVEAGGLVELADNNPMVCADVVTVPGPVATLALIALGPLVQAGLVLEEPVLQVAGAGEEDVPGFLGRDAFVSYGEEYLQGCVAVNAMAVITTPGDWGEIDELYRERFAHSFYVREHMDEKWDVSLVKDRPFALYSLACTQGEETSLLTVKAMADRDGKCGAAQIVHAMNVMCGFEESLGIVERV